MAKLMGKYKKEKDERSDNNHIDIEESS